MELTQNNHYPKELVMLVGTGEQGKLRGENGKMGRGFFPPPF